MTQKVILVTGASSGLGREIARQMHNKGHIVYAAARSLTDGSSDKNYYTCKLDVTDETASSAVLDKIISREGKLDILVLAAGFGLAGAVEDTSIEEAKNQLETNFFGAMTLLPITIASMRHNKGGTIVFLGSVAGVLPIPFQAYYSAGKAALTAFSLALADELKPFGISCLLVQPGDTRTGFTGSRIFSEKSGQSSAYYDRCRKSIERMAQDEENGMTAAKTASMIVARILRKRPPLIYTPGFKYNVFLFLNRLLPIRIVRLVVRLLYAS